jgi:hypothetical protein
VVKIKAHGSRIDCDDDALHLRDRSRKARSDRGVVNAPDTIKHAEEEFGLGKGQYFKSAGSKIPSHRSVWLTRSVHGGILMDLEEYQRLRRRIDEQYQADISAIDRIWQLSNGEAVPVRESNSRPEGLEQAVRALLPNIDGVFTKRTIANGNLLAAGFEDVGQLLVLQTDPGIRLCVLDPKAKNTNQLRLNTRFMHLSTSC